MRAHPYPNRGSTPPILLLLFLLGVCPPVNVADETDSNARVKVDKLWVEQQVAEECIVSTFGAWSQCSAPCGGGYTKRTRSVLQQGVPRSGQGASICPGLSQRRECNTMPCAVACRVSSWGAYMRCRAPCEQSGITMRSRSVRVPPAFGGRKCPSLVQLKACLGICTPSPRSTANSVMPVTAASRDLLNSDQAEDVDAARERKRLQLLAQLHALGPPRRNPRAEIHATVSIESSDVAVDTAVLPVGIATASEGIPAQSRLDASRAQRVTGQRLTQMTPEGTLKSVRHTSDRKDETVRSAGVVAQSASTSGGKRGRSSRGGGGGNNRDNNSGNGGGSSAKRGSVGGASMHSSDDARIDIDNGASASSMQSSTVAHSAGALCQKSSPWASRAGQEPQCRGDHEVSPPTLGQDWTHRLSFEVVQPDGSTLLVHGGQLKTTSPNTSKMTQTGMFLTWHALVYVAFACIVVVLACVYVIARFFGVTFWFRRHATEEAGPPQSGSVHSEVRDGPDFVAAEDMVKGRHKREHDVAVAGSVSNVHSVTQSTTAKKIASSESMPGVEATAGIASKLNASLSTLFFRPEAEGRTWVDDDGVEWQVPEHSDSDSDSDRSGHGDGGIFMHSSSDEDGQSLNASDTNSKYGLEPVAPVSPQQSNGSQLHLSPSTAPQGTIVNQTGVQDDLAWPPKMLPPPAVDTSNRTSLRSGVFARSSRGSSAAASPHSPGSPLYTRGQEHSDNAGTTVAPSHLSRSPRRVLAEAGRALEQESMRQQHDAHGGSATPSNSSACQSPRLNPAAKVFTPSRCASPAVCSLPPSVAASPKLNVMHGSIDNISPLASPQQKPQSPSTISLPPAHIAGPNGTVSNILQQNNGTRRSPPTLGQGEASVAKVETFGDPEVDADYEKFLAQIETDANDASTSRTRDGTETVATHTPITPTTTTLYGDTATDMVSAAVSTRQVQHLQGHQTKQATPRKVGNMEVRSQRYATDFHQIRSLGAGGFGKVYLCRSKLDAREYAVKIVKLGTGTQQRLQKMLREMKVLADLNHVHIVRYYQAWLEEDGDASDSDSETSKPGAFSSNVQTRSEHHSACRSGTDVSKVTGNCQRSGSHDASADIAEVVELSNSWRSDGGKLASPKALTVTASSHSESDEDDEHTKCEFDASMTRSWGGFQFQSTSKAFSAGERPSAATTDAPSHTVRRPSLLVRDACLEVSGTVHDTATLTENDSRRITFVQDSADAGSGACVVGTEPLLEPAPNLDGKPRSKAMEKHGLTLYILMEFCSQRTLREHLDNRSTNAAAEDADGDWKPDLDEVFRCMVQIASALEYIHSQKLIHRDLKPSNIFKGEDNTLKLGDFGLARTTNSHVSGSHVSAASSPRNVVHRRADDVGNLANVLLSKNTQGVGTALYMSPEQMQGREYDAKTDIYSLGVVLFELLHPPFATTMERYKTLSVLHDPQQQGSCSQGEDRDESSAALGEGQATSRYPAGMIERVRKLPNGESLIDLLNRLLAEHAIDRPTAAEALGSLNDMVHTPASVDSRADSVMTDGNLDVALRVEAVPSLQPVAFMTLVNQTVEAILPASTITRMNFKEMEGKRIVELGLLLHLDGSTESASDAHASHVADATQQISLGLQALPEVLSTEVHKK